MIKSSMDDTPTTFAAEVVIGNHKYTCGTKLDSGLPVIVSHTTQKTWEVSWEDLVRTARVEGIDRLEKEG